MALLYKSAHSLPNSTKVLLASLGAVSSLIFLIKLNVYRSSIGSEGSSDLRFHDILVPYLQLVPRTTIFNPWVVVTAIFAEISVFSLLVSTIVLFLASKYVERFWGFREVLKFVFTVGTLTNLWTVLVTILVNMWRGDSASMDKPLGGGISYYFGFLVVLKQLIPEHNVILFQGLINFRIKHLPFTTLCLVSVWSLLLSRSLYPAVPSIASFVISYSYLRFYQSIVTESLLPVTSANGSSSDSSNSSFVTGDASDAFRLSEFFPSVIKPYVAPVFDHIYEVSSLVGLITPFNDESIEQSNLRAVKRQEQATHSSKSVANSVAERRRQVALQMIEERINKEPQAE
ncbi:transmembrane protein 115 homolog [[Candida] anglica]|uniref:Transmembrane protein 115 homolog n=1 Tax=[Candida] anglica TaxID=148631 RepID=A0ABP0EIX1_9ASCO